jgi:hypothetical protein
MTFRPAAILAFVLTAFVTVAAAQRSRPVARPTPKPAPLTVPSEIPDADWKSLTDALEAEDWTKATELGERHLSVLKAENDRKQLARLRYLRLFSMAGEILARNARGDSAGAEGIWMRLDRAVAESIGKEFVLPPRTFAADCAKKLNFICIVRGTTNAVRMTATNLEGNGIHSFDYVRFAGTMPEFSDADAKYFIAGVLEKAEYNDDPAKPWVLRLFFKDGSVRRADR